MISVTLSFPSLDAALRGLREVPQNLLIGTPVESAATFDPNSDKTQVIPREVIDAAIKEAKAEKKAVKQDPAATPTTAPAAAAPEKKAEPSAEKPASVEYPVLQKAVFALAGKSREAAAAVAASFGVKTFKELDAAKWGEALAAVQAKVAELEAA